jgi:hypothetical protein
MPQGEIPAGRPVLLYITRFHPSLQGFSGSYGKFTGFQVTEKLIHPPVVAIGTQPVGLPKSIERKYLCR